MARWARSSVTAAISLGLVGALPEDLGEGAGVAGELEVALAHRAEELDDRRGDVGLQRAVGVVAGRELPRGTRRWRPRAARAGSRPRACASRS